MNDTNHLLDILKEAIAIEIYGKEYYSIFAEVVEDENAKSMFGRLAKEEGKHREIVEKEYRKLSGKAVDLGVLDEESRAKARHIFPESLEAMSITETKDVLKLGIRTEERSIELYSMGAQETKDSSSKELFLKLVQFEEGHKQTLEDALYYLEQEGTWYGYHP